LTAALAAAAPYDACLLDCVTLWASNLLLKAAAATPDDDNAATSAVLEPVRELIAWQKRQAPPLIAVTNEVGTGLVPEYPLGRVFRDALGEANQLLAAASARAYLCVAGYALDLKSGLPIR
jgi:adenosylcobinamide kinase/adenosylcobinamide-phosphate guanylyltransferase